MRELLVSIIFILTTTSCTQEVPHYSSDSADSTTIVCDRVGRIVKGDKVKSLYEQYGDNHVKVLINNDGDSISQNKRRYYTYSEQGELLFIAIAPKSGEERDLIEHIIINSPSLSTADSINVDSSVKQITTSYPNATLMQHQQDFYIYVPTVDLYFKINPSDIAGYNRDFLVHIPIDSVRADALPINMSVNWYVQQDNTSTIQYWQALWRRSVIWLTNSLPKMIIQVAIVYLLLQFVIWLIHRVQKIIVKRAEEQSGDHGETTKRVNTLVGIIKGLLSIIAWITIILVILSTLNINIGPIIASAGIVGLAVGFGAQELVRDYISGFFIIFENQLRTGDVAIIDGREGTVEKIELRTITLRDISGVVHIFQNGKINYLSNMTKEWSAISLEIGVSYSEDVDHVMEVIKSEGESLRADKEYKKLMLADVEVLGLDKFDDSAVVFKVIIRTRPRMQWRVKREFQRRLKIAFDREGIEIPFPQVTVNQPKIKE